MGSRFDWMMNRPAICAVSVWLIAPAASSAVQPGYYPPDTSEKRVKSDAEDSSQHELHDMLRNPEATALWIEAPDQIKVLSLSPRGPDPFKKKCHTREEVAQYLKEVPIKKLLRVFIASPIMWRPAEKAESLAQDILPFVQNSGFERVLILGLKPHDDGHTFMHPSNGCVRAGILVLSDWSTSRASDECKANESPKN